VKRGVVIPGCAEVNPSGEGRVKRGVVLVTLGGITGGQLRWWLGLLPARPIMADAAMDRETPAAARLHGYAAGSVSLSLSPLTSPWLSSVAWAVAGGGLAAAGLALGDTMVVFRTLGGGMRWPGFCWSPWTSPWMGRLVTSLPHDALDASHGCVPHYKGVVPKPLVRRTCLFPKTEVKCEEVASVWAVFATTSAAKLWCHPEQARFANMWHPQDQGMA